MARESTLSQEQRQTVISTIEGSFGPSSTTRSRRFLENVQSLARSSYDAPLFFLPIIVSAHIATKIAERLGAARRRRRMRGNLQRIHRFIEECQRIHADRLSRSGAVYRESPTSTTPEVTLIFTAADRVLLIRYSVSAPIPGEVNRVINGVGLVVIGAGRIHLPVGAWSDRRDSAIDWSMANLRSTLEWCLARKLTVEFWTWNKGDAHSLEVT